ncbi:hypothetical protein AX17_005080 [Amanita inopinata Kibby_2008]|nr:hypothetical protein AX17_005080 [Amanita inopinata Kibby_2008]
MTPLDYIPAVEAPQPTVPVNMSHFDRRSPTAPPNLAPQSHTHLTHSDSRIILPMEVDRHSPVAAKVLSRIGSKWISTLTNTSDPNLSYPEANLIFNNIPGPAKPLVIDSSSKNCQTCLSRIKEDIEDGFLLLLGSTTEMDRFNFIIELANALTFDLPSVPYAIMSDFEYRRSLDFLADYRTSLYNAHQVNATLRAENAKLQQELDMIKSQQMAVTVTTSNTKHQGGKKPTKSNATMSANQHAQMITNIISRHPDTSINEAYKYSNTIRKRKRGRGKKKTPPPVPNATRPNRLANMTSPKTFAQAAANPSTNQNPWQTTKWVGITRPTFRGTSNKLVKVSLKNLEGMNLVHDIKDMICIVLGGQQLLLKKAITWCSWSTNDILTVYFNAALTDKEIELVTLTLGGQAAVAIKAPNVSFVKFMNVPTIDQRGHPIEVQDYMECVFKDARWRDIKIFKMPYYATPLKNPDAISTPLKISIFDDEKGTQAGKVKLLSSAPIVLSGVTPRGFAGRNQTVLSAQAATSLPSTATQLSVKKTNDQSSASTVTVTTKPRMSTANCTSYTASGANNGPSHKNSKTSVRNPNSSPMTEQFILASHNVLKNIANIHTVLEHNPDIDILFTQEIPRYKIKTIASSKSKYGEDIFDIPAHPKWAAIYCNMEESQVAIFIRKSLLDMFFIFVKPYVHYNILAIQLTTHTNETITLTNVYHKPTDGVIELIDTSADIIAGDFNAHHLAWDTCPPTTDGQRILDHMLAADLQLLDNNFTPTWKRLGSRPSVIDLVFIKERFNPNTSSFLLPTSDFILNYASRRTPKKK